MDMVYYVAATVRPIRVHSASAFLTGLLLFGLTAQLGIVALLAGGVKLVLYVHRKSCENVAEIGIGRAAVALSRIIAGFLAPLALWFADENGATLLVIGSCLLGELIDRVEFYHELDIITPERQMLLDLHTESFRTAAAQQHVVR